MNNRAQLLRAVKTAQVSYNLTGRQEFRDQVDQLCELMVKRPQRRRIKVQRPVYSWRP